MPDTAQDPVVKALRAALAAQPHPDLHLAIAERCRALGDAAAALEACQVVLESEPMHTRALEQAIGAAEALGDDSAAAGYRALLGVARGTGAAPPVAAVPRPLVPPQSPQSPQAPGANPPAPTPLRVTGAGEIPDEPPAGGQGGPGGRGRVLQLLPGGDEIPDPEALTFDDVGGLQDVKRRIDLAFLAPLRDPSLFAAYGKRISGGLLLYGPPGCGKTHIARATAGEVGARFVSIGLIDVLNMYIGESERQLHELFEEARANAPTVIFLDELDAIGQKRSQLRHNAGRKLVNQLLVELDGLGGGSGGDGVYVLAATNHPWDVDPALKRPGRFDRTVLVPPPDGPARRHILERHMADRPAEGLDYGVLASNTGRYSGADLVHLCDSAIDLVVERAMQSGQLEPVRMNDFRKALAEVKPSIGPWVETARNYATYANEGGAYDELAAWLKDQR